LLALLLLFIVVDSVGDVAAIIVRFGVTVTGVYILSSNKMFAVDSVVGTGSSDSLSVDVVAVDSVAGT
jgi:hypothetical protein